jgi:pyruvyltransferase
MESAKGIIKSALRQIRRHPGKRLFWVGREKDCPNFGDLLGPYLYRKITGTEPVFSQPSNVAFHSVYMTVGSLLHWCRENCIVWGSGVIYQGQQFPAPQKTLAVRGPITRAHFLSQGYACPEEFGDPGLLVPLFYTPERPNALVDIGIIPHYSDKLTCRELVGDDSSIKLIDVFDPIEKVVDQIVSCKTIFSSSLHGIILAHAYGVPAIWLRISDGLWGDDTKFHDYFGSVELPHTQPLTFTGVADVLDFDEGVLKRSQPPRGRIDRLQSRLIDCCPFGQ